LTNAQIYNLVLTVAISLGVSVAVYVYFVLLTRHLKSLQYTVLNEIDRLRVTLSRPQLAPTIDSEQLAKAISISIQQYWRPPASDAGGYLIPDSPDQPDSSFGEETGEPTDPMELDSEEPVDNRR